MTTLKKLITVLIILPPAHFLIVPATLEIDFPKEFFPIFYVENRQRDLWEAWHLIALFIYFVRANSSAVTTNCQVHKTRQLQKPSEMQGVSLTSESKRPWSTQEAWACHLFCGLPLKLYLPLHPKWNQTVIKTNTAYKKNKFPFLKARTISPF